MTVETVEVILQQRYLTGVGLGIWVTCWAARTSAFSVPQIQHISRTEIQIPEEHSVRNSYLTMWHMIVPAPQNHALIHKCPKGHATPVHHGTLQMRSKIKVKAETIPGGEHILRIFIHTGYFHQRSADAGTLWTASLKTANQFLMLSFTGYTDPISGD